MDTTDSIVENPSAELAPELTDTKDSAYTLTPHQVVAELDKYIIGQSNAKRSVAIALRNRWRRQQVTGALSDEIMPNNIILIGPTGVGKTEIARRLAKLAGAPFIKVEATKYTEVGYVGRDVESMIRDLAELGVAMVKSEMAKTVAAKAQENADERILDILLPPLHSNDDTPPPPIFFPGMQHGGSATAAPPRDKVKDKAEALLNDRTRKKFRKKL